MREIKFRVYDKINKIMINNIDQARELCEKFDKGSYKLDEWYPMSDVKIFFILDWLDNKQFDIMQYTGLKDKNGTEIYEGDILRNYGNEIEDWIVSYEYGKFVGTFDNICEDLYELSDLEVIGNIYENNDLLKEDEISVKDKK